ncbi:MAG TPA: hypothetical protein VE913_19600 [Longimicrobium sp.]|nr:hypothetical protein [Longimicrobium sp.]
MGLTRAVVWAPVAVLIGIVVDADGSMAEMWVMIGVLPGFIAGVVFAALLGIAERRGVDELSPGRAGAWGALAGVLVGVLPFTIGEPASALPLRLLASATVGLSAASAAGSLALAGMSGKREMLGAGPR